MTISNCHGLCHRDEDTGELYCPACRGWVEACPKSACMQSRAHAPVFNESEAHHA